MTYFKFLLLVPCVSLISCSATQLQETAEIVGVVGEAATEAAPALAANPSPLGAIVAGGSVLAALVGHIHAKKKRRS